MDLKSYKIIHFVKVRLPRALTKSWRCPLFGRKKHKLFTPTISSLRRHLNFVTILSITFCSRSWCQTSWQRCPRCHCSIPSTCSWTPPSPWLCSRRSGRWSTSCTGCQASGGPPAFTNVVVVLILKSATLFKFLFPRTIEFWRPCFV